MPHTFSVGDVLHLSRKSRLKGGCGHGRLLIGDNGFILGNEVYPASRANKTDRIPKTIPRSADHYQEWIAACKGGKAAGSNFDWAGPLAESVLPGGKASWDSGRA